MAATLATEEGKFDMKMHDLGPKIAYLQEQREKQNREISRDAM